MGLIVDTCIFIQAEKQGTPLNDFSRWKDESIYISAITASELLVGVHRANTADRRVKRMAFVDSILSHIPVLDFTLDTARIHAELYAELAKCVFHSIRSVISLLIDHSFHFISITYFTPLRSLNHASKNQN